MARAERKGDSLKDETPGAGTPRASNSNSKAEEPDMRNSIPENKSSQGAQVIPFRFETREVRTLLIDDQPWFVASDVAKALDYQAAKDMARNLDDDERGRHIVPTLSGDQEMTIINESGLYSAILRSRKAEARRFKKWVTSEVLPAIRKHGRYEDTRAQMGTLIGTTIGSDGFHCLAAVLDGKVRRLPAPARKRAKMHIWSQIHKAFSVVSAEDIPADQMDSARNFVAAYTLEGEWLPADRNDEYSYPVKRWLANNPALARAQVGRNRLSIPAAAVSMGSGADSPTRQVLGKLRAAGHDVEACFIEIDALQHHLEASRNRLLRVAEDVQQTAAGALQIHRKAG